MKVPLSLYVGRSNKGNVGVGVGFYKTIPGVLKHSRGNISDGSDKWNYYGLNYL